jgi:hypothetical protein
MLCGQPVCQIDLPQLPQTRQHVTLLVFVVLRGGQIKVAQDVSRGVAGLRVGAVTSQVVGKLQQQAQTALDALVAGLQHLEGLLEANGWGAVQKIQKTFLG